MAVTRTHLVYRVGTAVPTLSICLAEVRDLQIASDASEFRNF